MTKHGVTAKGPDFLTEQKRLAEDAQADSTEIFAHPSGDWSIRSSKRTIVALDGLIESVPRMIAALEAVMAALEFGDELEKTEGQYLDPTARRLQIQNRILNRIESGVEAALLGGEGDATAGK